MRRLHLGRALSPKVVLEWLAMVDFHNIKVTWDKHKNASNFKKHGIRFEDAKGAFLDKHRHMEPDPYEYEDRWRTTGMIDNMLVLFVVHTSRDEGGTEVVRIISARKATRRERETYYGNR